MSAAFKFQPFSQKQLKLLTWWTENSPQRDKDMIICDGSVRAGKTVSMIVSFVKWSLSQHSGQKFILAGRSIGSLKRNVIDPMLQTLRVLGIPYTYNRSEHVIQIGTNTYHCFGASTEASQDTLQGLTAAGSLADEAALFPRSFFDQMIARCSVEGSKIWLNCNPGGPFHWLKTEFIDKAAEKNILRLHFVMDDNPSLSRKVKERYKRMYSGVFYRRYILGQWAASDGLVYDAFDVAMHVVDKLPQIRRYWIGTDYGTSNATVYLLAGLGEDGRLYVIDEWMYSGRDTGRNMSPSQLSAAFKKWSAEIGVDYEAMFIDPSAEGFIAQLYQDGVRRIKLADNSVLPGIQLVSSLIASDMLRVHRKCKNLLTEFGSYAWDPKAQEKGLDKPIKQFDHSLDSLRYLANGTKTLWQRALRAS